jgi:hypothetical protein
MIKEEDIRFDEGRSLQGRRDTEFDLIHAGFQIQSFQLIRRENHRFLHSMRLRRLLFLFHIFRDLFHFTVFLFTVITTKKEEQV